MTPQRAGRLTCFVVFASMAALEGAVTIARNATGTDDGVSNGELALAIRVVALAAAAGVLVARIAASRCGRRTAVITAMSSYLVIGVGRWWRATNSPRAPEEDPVRYALGLIATFVTLGTAFALAAVVVAWWIVRNAVGRDGAKRVLALEAASLHGSRDRWGAAMRANSPASTIPYNGADSHEAPRSWHFVMARVGGRRSRRSRRRRRGCRGLQRRAHIIRTPARSWDHRRAHHGARGVASRRGRDRGHADRQVVPCRTRDRSRPRCSPGSQSTAALWLWRFHKRSPGTTTRGILLLDGEGAARAGVDAIGAALQPVTHYAFIVVSVLQLVIAVPAAGFGALVLRGAQRLWIGLREWDRRQPW